MVFLVLIGGIIIVRVLAHVMENWPRFLRALIATAIGVGLGIWGFSVDWSEIGQSGGSIMSILNVFLFVPSLLGVGTSVTLVTLGAGSDGSYWNEYFRVGDTSYGLFEEGFGLIGKILLAVVLSGGAFLILILLSDMFFSSFIAAEIIYFGIQGVVFLKTIFSKD